MTTLTTLPLHATEPSLTNPRKHFDPAKLQELADSIAASGIHQPILVRPLPGSRVADTAFERNSLTMRAHKPTHEIIAGERRYRAAKLAGLTEVPVIIKDMTDQQVLEAQVIENLQRADLTEMEEAEGYQALMDAGELTAVAIAAKVGKSRSYIMQRLKLLDLCTECRDALRQGDIEASVAILLARITDQRLQIAALTNVRRKDYEDRPMSVRDAANYIQRQYTLRLEDARFDTQAADLVPTAGACATCPNRTGANPELWADVKSADVCTHPPCYHAKEAAATEAQMRQAHERGQTVIAGREAKALMPNAWTTHVEGYLRLDDVSDSPTDKPLRSIIGKAMAISGITEILVANPHHEGELVAVLPTEQVHALLKQAAATSKKAQEAQAEMARTTAEADKRAKQAEVAEAAKEYEQRWRWLLLERTWAAIKAAADKAAEAHPYASMGDVVIALDLTEPVVRLLATHRAGSLNQDRAKRLCQLLDLGKVAPAQGLVDYAKATHHPNALLLLLTMEADVEHRHWLHQDPNEANPGLMIVASECGISVDQVQKDAQAEVREARQAKAAADAEKNQAKADLPLAPAAQADGVGGGGKPQKRGPAAPARRVAPKTTAAEASAGIAAALAQAEADQGGQGDHEQRPAGESIEAAPLHHQATPEPERPTDAPTDETPAKAGAAFTVSDAVLLDGSVECLVINRKSRNKEWAYTLRKPDGGVITMAQGSRLEALA